MAASKSVFLRMFQYMIESSEEEMEIDENDAEDRDNWQEQCESDEAEEQDTSAERRAGDAAEALAADVPITSASDDDEPDTPSEEDHAACQDILRDFAEEDPRNNEMNIPNGSDEILLEDEEFIGGVLSDIEEEHASNDELVDVIMHEFDLLDAAADDDADHADDEAEATLPSLSPIRGGDLTPGRAPTTPPMDVPPPPAPMHARCRKRHRGRIGRSGGELSIYLPPGVQNVLSDACTYEWTNRYRR